MEHKLSEKQKQIRAQEQEFLSLKAQLEEMEIPPANMDISTLDEKNETIQALQEQIQELQEKLSDMEDSQLEKSEDQSILEEKEEVIQIQQEKLQELQEKLDTLSEEISNLTQEKEHLEHALEKEEDYQTEKPIPSMEILSSIKPFCSGALQWKIEQGQDQPPFFPAETKYLTMIFISAKNFLPITRLDDINKSVELVKTYYSWVIEKVVRNNGFIDKIMSGSIVALFGLQDYEKYGDKMSGAMNAVKCAWEIQKEIHGINRKIVYEGLPELEIGIGIHSGEVVLTEVGDEHLKTIAVLGDNFLLTSSIEGLNKAFNISILMSEKTVDWLDESFVTEKLRVIRIKEYEEEFAVYSLLDIESQVETTDAEETGFDLLDEEENAITEDAIKDDVSLDSELNMSDLEDESVDNIEEQTEEEASFDDLDLDLSEEASAESDSDLDMADIELEAEDKSAEADDIDLDDLDLDIDLDAMDIPDKKS